MSHQKINDHTFNMELSVLLYLFWFMILSWALTEQKATVRQKNRTGYEVGRCTQKSPPRENTLALRKKYENGVGYMQFM